MASWSSLQWAHFHCCAHVLTLARAGNREQQETQRCSQTYNGSPLSPTHGKCYSMCLVRCNYTCASLRLIVIANDKQKSVAAGKPARQINIKQFSNLVLDRVKDHVEDDEHDEDNDVVKDENAGK